MQVSGNDGFLVGRKIREAREGAGMSREQVAVSLGVAYGTIVRWETSRTEPSVSKVQQIAAITGLPLSFFVTDEVAA
jgi:transcriptional regulator with XRE-family HTH domain